MHGHGTIETTDKIVSVKTQNSCTIAHATELTNIRIIKWRLLSLFTVKSLTQKN